MDGDKKVCLDIVGYLRPACQGDKDIPTARIDDFGTRRIVFHEITKNAILRAIEHPRQIDLNLVDAQQARRILDRIVGFELSPVLWRKVKPALSAGRVQSVAVRLIAEREREIQAFHSEAAYRVTAVFPVPDANGKPVEMKAELEHRFKTKEEARRFLESCKDATFTIRDVATRPLKKSPAAPSPPRPSSKRPPASWASPWHRR